MVARYGGLSLLRGPQVPRRVRDGCKTIIGARRKQSGMFRTVRGANAILSLRCCYCNGRFEDYWEARRAA